MQVDPTLWGWISITFSTVSGIAYLWSIFFRQTRPHVFTWVIWSILTSIAFTVQYTEGAGAGSWATGISAAFCIVTVAACYWKGERHITKSDWIVFILSLSAIPLWVISKNPVVTIVLVTSIDVAAYIPTIRKSWGKPREEMIFGTYLSNVKYITSLAAMENWHFTTILYPLAMLAANTALIGVVHLRRYYTRIT